MRILGLMLALAIFLPATSRAADKSGKQAPSANLALDGTWNIIKRVKNGQEEDVKQHPGSLTFAGKRVTEMRDNATQQAGTFIVDDSKDPKRISLTGTEGPNAGTVFEAIYEISGDTLKLAYSIGSHAATPPKNFEPADNVGILMLQRQKP